jgi:hypothetical protein
VDVFARRDTDPDGLMESALLPWEFGTVILGAVGMWATLGVEFVIKGWTTVIGGPHGTTAVLVIFEVVLVIFEREGFKLPLGSFFLLDFGVHVISFPTGSSPSTIEIP